MISLFLFTTLVFGQNSGDFSGKDLRSGSVSHISKGENGSVLIFLSAKCPCSNSHIEEVKNLSKEYPKYQFIGIHSNVDENLADSQFYFKSLDLPFPVFEDEHSKLAIEFKALKTPHAFLLSKSGETLYKGGVSSSRDFSASDRKYLREALADSAAGKKVKTPEGRTLGCVIERYHD